MPDTSPAQHAGLAHYTDADVSAAVSIRDAIDALRRAFLAAHDGGALTVPKTVLQWSDADGVSSAHALGAVDVVAQRLAFKYWVHTPRGAAAMLTLFDLRRGAACAAMEAGGLGMLRTSGAAALATDALAAADADRLAILGTGRQSLHQVRAVAEVRRLGEVRVWSRTRSHAEDFARHVTADLGLSATVHSTVREAVRDVPIVTAITRAREPFVELADLAQGVHLNALGAILPGAREIFPEVVEAADLIVVDDRENARTASSELRESAIDVDGLPTLGEVLSRRPDRAPSTRLTMFKALGSGVGDLAIASAAFDRIGHREARG